MPAVGSRARVRNYAKVGHRAEYASDRGQFVRIAFATSAEHADQSPSSSIPCRPKAVTKCFWGIRRVDDHCKILARHNPFHPTREPVDGLETMCDCGQFDAVSQRGCRRGEAVVR